MTVYEKIMESKEILLSVILDSVDNNKDIDYNCCAFCYLHPHMCIKTDISCYEGFLRYYEEHPDFFSKDFISIEKLADIIISKPENKVFSKIEMVKNLSSICTERHEDLFNELKNKIKNRFHVSNLFK